MYYSLRMHEVHSRENLAKDVACQSLMHFPNVIHRAPCYKLKQKNNSWAVLQNLMTSWENNATYKVKGTVSQLADQFILFKILLTHSYQLWNIKALCQITILSPKHYFKRYKQQCFLCPFLMTCWLFHSHICFTKLKIYHLSFLSSHSVTSTLLMLAVCRTRVKYEPSMWPRSPWVLRSLSGWSARPVFGRSEVWIPLGTQIFSLSQARDMLIISFSHLFHQA